MATIKDYDTIIAILRSRLLTNSELASFIATWENNGISSKAIYSAYMDSVVSPVYPSITIYCDTDRTLTDKDGFTYCRYYIHGWVNTNASDAAYLRNLVIATLDLKKIDGLVTCRKVNAKCPLYDSNILAHYFMSDWLIYANQSLMYAE